MPPNKFPVQNFKYNTKYNFKRIWSRRPRKKTTRLLRALIRWNSWQTWCISNQMNIFVELVVFGCVPLILHFHWLFFHILSYISHILMKFRDDTIKKSGNEQNVCIMEKTQQKRIVHFVEMLYLNTAYVSNTPQREWFLLLFITAMGIHLLNAWNVSKSVDFMGKLNQQMKNFQPNR